MIHEELTEKILGAAFEVSNTLGCGFLEKVYERALLHELRLRNLKAITQAPFPVIYKGKNVGQYYADMLIEDTVIVEIKNTDRLINDHKAQCLNYLRASKIELALLINFHDPILDWKRVISTHHKIPQTESPHFSAT